MPLKFLCCMLKGTRMFDAIKDLNLKKNSNSSMINHTKIAANHKDVIL